MTYFSTNQSTGIFIFTCVIILNRFIPRYTPEIRVLTLSYHIPIQYYVACVNRKIGRKGHGTEKLLFFSFVSGASGILRVRIRSKETTLISITLYIKQSTLCTVKPLPDGLTNWHKSTQVFKTRTCVAWPNGFPSRLASSHASRKEP